MNKEKSKMPAKKTQKNDTKAKAAQSPGVVSRMRKKLKASFGSGQSRPKTISLNKLRSKESIQKSAQKVKSSFFGLSPRKRLGLVVGVAMLLVFFGMVLAQRPPKGPALVTLSNGQTRLEDIAQEGDSIKGGMIVSAIDNITSDPARYAQVEIEVSGLIENAFNNRIFRLTDANSGNFLYIITPRSLNSDESEKTQNLFDGSNRASVVGTIKTFNNTDLAEQLNIVLEGDLKKDFAAKRLLLIVKTFTINRN